MWWRSSGVIWKMNQPLFSFLLFVHYKQKRQSHCLFTFLSSLAPNKNNQFSMWLYFDCYASFLPRIIEWWNGLSGNWAEAEEERKLGWAAQGAGLGLGVIIIIQVLKKKKKIDWSIDYLFIIIWVCDVGRRRGFKKEEEEKKKEFVPDEKASLVFIVLPDFKKHCESREQSQHCTLPFLTLFRSFHPIFKFQSWNCQSLDLFTLSVVKSNHKLFHS